MSDFENNVNSPTLQNNAISIRCKYAEVLMELRDCGISHYTEIVSRIKTFYCIKAWWTYVNVDREGIL